MRGRSQIDGRTAGQVPGAKGVVPGDRVCDCRVCWREYYIGDGSRVGFEEGKGTSLRWWVECGSGSQFAAFVRVAGKRGGQQSGRCGWRV